MTTEEALRKVLAALDEGFGQTYCPLTQRQHDAIAEARQTLTALDDARPPDPTLPGF